MPKRNRDFEVYLVHIDSERCNGCELCFVYCPAGVFEMSEKAVPVRPRNCLGCGACEVVCKSKAVTVTEI